METSFQERERIGAGKPSRCDIKQGQFGYRAGMGGNHALGSLFAQWFFLDHCSPHKSFKREKDIKSCWGPLSLGVPNSVLLAIT